MKLCSRGHELPERGCFLTLGNCLVIVYVKHPGLCFSGDNNAYATGLRTRSERRRHPLGNHKCDQSRDCGSARDFIHFELLRLLTDKCGEIFTEFAAIRVGLSGIGDDAQEIQSVDDQLWQGKSEFSTFFTEATSTMKNVSGAQFNGVF